MISIPVVPNTPSSLDPNLFAIKWDVVAEILVTIIVLSFFVERALSLLFESRWFLGIETLREGKGKGSFKPLIAFGASAALCVLWHFDALSIIVTQESSTLFGCLLTGGVIAGGSKASIKLFHDVMDVRSTTSREISESKKPPSPPPLPPPTPVHGPSPTAPAVVTVTSVPTPGFPSASPTGQ